MAGVDIEDLPEGTGGSVGPAHAEFGNGRRPAAGPCQERNGTQISRFGTTPGGHLGDHVADHNGGYFALL
ncbi:MAG TPA: hypothetical protein VLW50_09245 [Streptosporangiaceae bacterium]|nr:hypothetical protein [Streptosporangiaceae bacterium]